MNALTLNMSTAAANASTATPGVGSNSDTRLTAILKQLRTLGAAETIGGASRRDAALALTVAAYDGNLLEGDADAAYDAYVTSAGKAASKKHLVVADASKSRTAQVSKFRAFIKLGMLPAVDGREILARATQALLDVAAAGNKVESPFAALNACATAQIAQPDKPLSDEQITKCVSKKEPADKDALAKLIAAYKAAHKLNDELKMPGTQDAVDGFASAIREIDEDAVPPMTKEEKKLAAFMTEARARGMF